MRHSVSFVIECNDSGNIIGDFLAEIHLTTFRFYVLILFFSIRLSGFLSIWQNTRKIASCLSRRPLRRRAAGREDESLLKRGYPEDKGIGFK